MPHGQYRRGSHTSVTTRNRVIARGDCSLYPAMPRAVRVQPSQPALVHGL